MGFWLLNLQYIIYCRIKCRDSEAQLEQKAAEMDARIAEIDT